MKKNNSITTRGLIVRVFNAMDKLAEKEITASEAIATAKLASQANNILNYELERTKTMIKLKQQGDNIESDMLKVREIED